jgi:TM2 domain-containing membrane protein YozV
MKRNAVAAVLSAILPGAGQFYNRQWIKGAGFFIAMVVLSAFIQPETLLFEPSVKALLPLVALLVLAFWSVVDAYRSEKSTS